MSSKTSSRSTLTTVPSTMSPSLKYLMVSSIAARKSSSDPMSLTATLGVGWTCVLLVMCRLAPADKSGLDALRPSARQAGLQVNWICLADLTSNEKPHGRPQLCLATAGLHQNTAQRSGYAVHRQWVNLSSQPVTCSHRPPAGYEGNLVSRLGPAAAGAEGDAERHLKPESTAHGLADELAQCGQLTGCHLENEFVVYLEQHPRAKPALAQFAVHPQHRHLDDVGGRSLDRRVQRHPLGHLPALPVIRGQVGQVPAAAEDGLGVAVLAGLCDHLVQVVPDAAELLEIFIHQYPRFIRRNAQLLGQAVGGQAVREPVVHCLDLAAHLAGDLIGRHAEDPGRRLGVKITARAERFLQRVILGEVRHDAQLDLAVVGREQ